MFGVAFGMFGSFRPPCMPVGARPTTLVIGALARRARKGRGEGRSFMRFDIEDIDSRRPHLAIRAARVALQCVLARLWGAGRAILGRFAREPCQSKPDRLSVTRMSVVVDLHREANAGCDRQAGFKQRSRLSCASHGLSTAQLNKMQGRFWQKNEPTKCTVAEASVLARAGDEAHELVLNRHGKAASRDPFAMVRPLLLRHCRGTLQTIERAHMDRHPASASPQCAGAGK